MRVDIVTVFHNETNYRLQLDLRARIAMHEPDGGYRFIAVDNRTNNRGFARACNLGARHPDADAPVIGFLNPDIEIDGPFIDDATSAVNDQTVIAGCRFDKPAGELRQWGVRDWVCGAAMFVWRPWFEAVGGFDEQFTWSWEETDLIRQAESQGLECRSIGLPIRHASPARNSDEDERYKRTHFERGSLRYFRKWGRPRAL